MKALRLVLATTLLAIALVVTPATPAFAATCEAQSTVKIYPWYSPYGVSNEGGIYCTAKMRHIHVIVELFYCATGCPANRYQIGYDVINDSYGIKYVYDTAVQANCNPGTYYGRTRGSATSQTGASVPIKNNSHFQPASGKYTSCP